MNNTTSIIIALAKELTNLVESYKTYFDPIRHCEIPIKGLNLCHYNEDTFKCLEVFDTLKFTDDHIYLFDYEHYQISQAYKYGYHYYGVSEKEFWDDEVYTRHYEGIGSDLERLPEDFNEKLIKYLRDMIEEYKVKLPKEAAERKARQEEWKRREKAINALPFIERYYIQQFGMHMYERDFHKKVVW